MDISISPTPEDWAASGMLAFDLGLGQDNHGMPKNHPGRKHWQYGWHQQRQRRERELVAQHLAGVSPP